MRRRYISSEPAVAKKTVSSGMAAVWSRKCGILVVLNGGSAFKKASAVGDTIECPFKNNVPPYLSIFPAPVHSEAMTMFWHGRASHRLRSKNNLNFIQPTARTYRSHPQRNRTPFTAQRSHWHAHDLFYDDSSSSIVACVSTSHSPFPPQPGTALNGQHESIDTFATTKNTNTKTHRFKR